jgi:hypothetical protein
VIIPISASQEARIIDVSHRWPPGAVFPAAQARLASHALYSFIRPVHLLMSFIIDKLFMQLLD